MYKFMFYLIIFLVHHSYAVIYNLNDTEYRQMPPVYQIDDYENCFSSPKNVYCSINFDLVSDQPNKLLHNIQEYSRHLITHYNHTKLRYGLCVTNSCQYIRNETEVSEHSLEGCLNKTMWKKYKLNAKVHNYVCYNDSDNNVQIDAADVIVFIVLLSLFVLNIIGSIYDEYWNKSGDKAFLLCFSLKRNWKRLTTPPQGTEPRLQKFEGIDGIRCIILFGVIIVHSFWAYLVAIKNAHALEQMFHSLALHLFFNGSTAIQAYIVISGLLLAHKMRLYAENHQITWRFIPKGIFLRYLRLTPAYAVVIALSATWLKFLGPSALWEVTAKPALADCQNRWWLNLLYLNNYVYNSQCMLHGWYVAVDMQLFCLGLVLCVLLNKSGYQRIILAAIFVVGMAVPGIITYLKDLDALLIIAPGEARYLFETDPTFNEMYKVGHTNIASFIIGIALGYIVYGLQQRKIDTNQFKNYRIIHWASLPLLIAIVISGSVFYQDTPKEPLYIRVIYATLAKPLFGFVMAIFICGLIFRIENIYSTFFESKIWSIPSKLSYCVYIIHFSYLRIHVAMHSHLLYITIYHIVLMATCVTTISLLTAVPLWLFVEAPFTELTKYITSNSPQKKKQIEKTNCENYERIDSNTYL